MYRAALCGALAVICCCLLAACGSSASSPTPAPQFTPISKHKNVPLIALVTDVGGLHDRSFNAEAWAGARRAHNRFGVDVLVRQSKTTEDYVPLLAQMARSHADLIIAVGSTMALAVHAVAQRFPDEHFAIVDARPQSSPGHEVEDINVANLLFKEQESGYLVGALAGLLERRRVGIATHNTIAWLGGEDIPPVNRYLAGFEAGVRRVDPSAIIQRNYAGTFADPATGRRWAAQQLKAGADIYFQVAAATGDAYLQAVEAAGKYGIGVDTNQSYLGRRTISSAVKRVNIAVYRAIIQQKNGRFKPYDHVMGAHVGATGFARPSAVVPPAIVAQVDAIQRQIAAGSIIPPVQLSAR